MALLDTLNLSNFNLIGSLQSYWKFALIFIVGFIVFKQYKKIEDNKKYSIDVSVHKKVGNGLVNIEKTAKQTKDEKGVIAFQSKDGEIDEPGFDSRYFMLSAKGPGRRHIVLYNPLPDVFVPYDYEHMSLFSKPMEIANDDTGLESECVYCTYITELKEKKIKIEKNVFKTKAFEEYVKKLNAKTLIVCKEHSTGYFKAKFKVLSETSVGWKLAKMKDRLLRAITKKAWYDNPLATQGLMMAGLLAFVVLVLKFGPVWFEAEVKEISVEVAKEVGAVLREQLSNVTAPTR